MTGPTFANKRRKRRFLRTNELNRKMRKHIRLLCKGLQKNTGGVRIPCILTIIILMYLFYLKKFVHDDEKRTIVGQLEADVDQSDLSLSTSGMNSFNSGHNWSLYHLTNETEFNENCGLKEKCSSESFPVHLYTGYKDKEPPQICINEKQMPSANIGRGFNVAVVDSFTASVIKFGNFDTFSNSSDDLEVFLEALSEDDIIIIVTHDEASSKLSANTRSLLSKLGSAVIQDLDYRDLWVFVGRKGLEGFSPSEYIEYVLPGSHWPKPINEKFCIEKKLRGEIIRPDEVSQANVERRMLCTKSQLKNSFCKKNHAEVSLRRTTMGDVLTSNNSICGVPIVIIPGADINLFWMQAEALMLNQKVIREMVHVFAPKDETLVLELAQLFKFKTHLLEELRSYTNYTQIFHQAIDRAWDHFHDKKHLIILEEAVIPSNNFFSFMTLAFDALEKDESLAGASSWNVKSHAHAKPRSPSIFTVRVFPGFGVLMRRSIYEMHLKNKLHECCFKRSWMGWDVGSDLKTIVPHASRVFRVPSLLDGSEFLAAQSVGIDRKFFTDLKSNSFLGHDTYTSTRRPACVVLPNDVVVEYCSSTSANVNDTAVISADQRYCIYYEQNNNLDTNVLTFLLSCFKMAWIGSRPPVLDQEMSRITETVRNVMIIGSLSPLAISLSKNHELFGIKHVNIIKQSSKV